MTSCSWIHILCIVLRSPQYYLFISPVFQSAEHVTNAQPYQVHSFLLWLRPKARELLYHGSGTHPSPCQVAAGVG